MEGGLRMAQVLPEFAPSARGVRRACALDASAPARARPAPATRASRKRLRLRHRRRLFELRPLRNHSYAAQRRAAAGVYAAYEAIGTIRSRNWSLPSRYVTGGCRMRCLAQIGIFVCCASMLRSAHAVLFFPAAIAGNYDVLGCHQQDC